VKLTTCPDTLWETILYKVFSLQGDLQGSKILIAVLVNWVKVVKRCCDECWSESQVCSWSYFFFFDVDAVFLRHQRPLVLIRGHVKTIFNLLCLWQDILIIWLLRSLLVLSSRCQFENGQSCLKNATYATCLQWSVWNGSPVINKSQCSAIVQRNLDPK